MSNEELKPEHQETLLQTIKARLERNEDGKVVAIYDPLGPYDICERTSGGLVTYFQPAYQPGIDQYGKITDKPTTNEQH